MGLLSTNPFYEKSVQEFADSWLQSNRSQSLIPSFMKRFWEYIIFFNNFQNLFIVVTQRTVNNAFFSYLNDERQKSTVNVIALSIGVELLAFLTFYFIARKFIQQDYQMKKMYKLVPVNVVIKTRILKYYLVESSGKLGSSLKRTF